MSGLGYTLPAVISVVAVCVLEWAVLRTQSAKRRSTCKLASKHTKLGGS
jgi:hypothetical protein